MSKLGTQYTLESWMIANGKQGDVFYSEKQDKDITAIATHHKRKVFTERCVVVVRLREESPLATKITRVILL